MDKRELVEKVVKAYQRKEQLLDKFQELFGYTGGVFTYDVISDLDNLNIELASNILGDKEGWLEWYLEENNCGAKNLTVKINGEEKTIKSIDDLLLLI